MFQIQELFASRGDVNEVIEYATRVGSANGDSVGTMTCTMMMYNTVGKLANARIAELEAKLARYEATLPPPLTFNPSRGFDSIQEALELIYAQPDPMRALLAIVEANIRMGESDFAGSLVTSFDLSEVE